MAATPRAGNAHETASCKFLRVRGGVGARPNHPPTTYLAEVVGKISFKINALNHLNHLNLLSIQFGLLTLWWLVRVLRHGRWRDAAGLAVSAALTSGISGPELPMQMVQP